MARVCFARQLLLLRHAFLVDDVVCLAVRFFTSLAASASLSHRCCVCVCRFATASNQAMEQTPGYLEQRPKVLYLSVIQVGHQINCIACV